jgi:hypothetical protein
MRGRLVGSGSIRLDPKSHFYYERTFAIMLYEVDMIVHRPFDDRVPSDSSRRSEIRQPCSPVPGQRPCHHHHGRGSCLGSGRCHQSGSWRNREDLLRWSVRTGR